MGSDLPKQFLELGGQILLDRAVDAFVEWADEVIVTLPDARPVSPRHDARVRYVPGGTTRTESVTNALGATRFDRVLVHDAARPFVPRVVMAEVAAALDDYHCAYPVMPVVNSLVVDKDGELASSPSRTQFREVQTPQGFRTDTLKRALAQFGDEHAHLPELIRRLGMPVKHTTGSPWLFKLTYAPSLHMAEYYLEHVAPGFEA